MKKRSLFTYIVYSLLFGLAANSYVFISKELKALFFIIPIALFINLFAGISNPKTKKKRLKICHHGAVLLLIFQISTVISIAYHIDLAFYILPDDYPTFIWSSLLCVLFEAILFWNGIICVYLSSVQLGIKHRVVGIVCGMIPIVNLIVLNIIIKIVLKEAYFEAEKEKINSERKADEVCKTKYPIVMVHGVFFRDSNFFNYWGRIPKELELNGADIYYGNHESAASVADSADELTRRIKEIVEKLDCEKVNIIAHSKGGLDCRYAISKLGLAPYVASLTTINTPHKGCLFAEYLLTKLPLKIKSKVEVAYNSTLRKFGDIKPDFIAAVSDLTVSSCAILNNELEMPDGIFCQSVGSRLQKARGGKFPLNFSYNLVKYFDGPNDGLVSEKSFEWGEKYTLLTSDKKRGISHGDMIDLNRENIDGFDVREFYVGLVSDLKNRGL